MAINRPNIDITPDDPSGGGGSSTPSVTASYAYVRTENGDVLTTTKVAPAYYVYTNTTGTFTLDKKLYPYIKVNGRYYVNDEKPFTLYTTQCALLMDKKMCYQATDSEGKISVLSAQSQNIMDISKLSKINRDDYIIEKSTKKNYVISVPNYNIDNKAVCGSIHVDSNNSDRNFMYPKQFNDKSTPDFWNFIPGCPRVIMDRTTATDKV